MGYKKTVEEYYTGATPEVHASVFDILHTVTAALLKDSRRKFTYVEMKFFNMWYKDLDAKGKENVKKLIKNG